MLISGVKHACAMCIRGHRSGTCTHANRPLFEIRKKGRPVSQCPHCRDLRTMKSCHTKCECGDSPAEQSKTNQCKCHTGAPCSCAGLLQVFQYKPPERSEHASVIQTNNEDVRTLPTGKGSMLHTFPMEVRSAEASSTPAGPEEHVTELARSHLKNEFELQNTTLATGDIDGASSIDQEKLRTVSRSGRQPPNFQTWIYNVDQSTGTYASAEHVRPRKLQRRGSSSISASSRSIGINTDPLPAGIWPDNPFELPSWMQNSEAHVEEKKFCCPKVRDMPLTDLGYVQSTPVGPAPIPFQSSYEPAGTTTIMTEDPYSEEFIPEYFDALFDVPGCSLAGVQCKCGDDCSCAGCRTHKDNLDKATFADFDRLVFAREHPSREHPANCCDTRHLHVTADKLTGSKCCEEVQL